MAELDDWDIYFLQRAYLISENATCKQRHVGAVLVKDKQILASGYNGAPFNLKNCLELGCLKEQHKVPIGVGARHDLCRAVHAEQNVIIQAALHGISTRHSTIYCTCSPCIICAKMLINAQISRFVASKEYPDDGYKSLFNEAHIIFDVLDKNRSLF